MENTQDASCGKTSPERSPQIKGRTSKQCLKPSAKSKPKMLLFLNLKKANGVMQEISWQRNSPLPGEFSMPNIGESPSAEDASILSQILQAGVQAKYYLSQKACLGILRRAAVRGKKLPEVLRVALEKQAQSA